MTFKGCTCNLCKATAISVVATVTFAHHGQFCEQQHRPTYCNLTRDVADGPHHDQPITWIRLSRYVIPSTSSSSDGMTKTDFFIRWVT